MTEILIHAPFAGWLTPLEDTPDAAFAQGMVGPGGTIDPIEGEVRAPFPGVVVAVAATRHAVTLKSDEGVELLIHVGIDTVALKGEGFTAHVAAGDRVQTGDLLLTVDLDGVAETARDLISPLIVTGGADQVRLLDPRRRVSCGDPVLAVRPLAATPDLATTPTVTRTVRANLPHGLHARPSARIAAALKPFDADVVIAIGGRTASAASVTALMRLNATDGDVLQLSASGAQADQAVDALVRLIEAGLEEASDTERPIDRPVATPTPSLIQTDDGEWVLNGVVASPGLALGRTVRLQTAEISVPMDGRGVEIERAALENALCVVRDRLDQAATDGALQQRAIARAHLGLLDDPALTQDAVAHIEAGRSAAYAWRETLQAAAALFRDLSDTRMAERADDLMDLNHQVVAVLTGGRAADGGQPRAGRHPDRRRPFAFAPDRPATGPDRRPVHRRGRPDLPCGDPGGSPGPPGPGRRGSGSGSGRGRRPGHTGRRQPATDPASDRRPSGPGAEPMRRRRPQPQGGAGPR